MSISSSKKRSAAAKAAGTKQLSNIAAAAVQQRSQQQQLRGQQSSDRAGYKIYYGIIMNEHPSNRRSINMIFERRQPPPRTPPSMVDGLKPGQRKVLFCSFKKNLVKETKVADFISYVSKHSAYTHGEQSLACVIIRMAQDFVGANNINLLEPRGQYGTRNSGGEDAAEALFIYTRLQPIARLIFPKDDDALLNYLTEAGKSIEPSWYMPIIPMVLVNGSGIGTGSSSYVPNYNPRDIIANLKRLLNEEAVVPMEPWYKGFKGSVKKTRSKAAGATYTISGVIEKVDDTKLRITELPIRCWTNDYKEFLESIHVWKEPTFLEECQSRCDHASVEFEVILSEQNMNVATREGLEKKFKLTTTIETTNMHLLDSDGKIRKYNTPEDILKEFFKLRLEYYWRRKAVMLKNIGKELLKPKNQVRFILAVISGDIVVNNRKRAELFLELKQKGYQPFPQKKVVANEVDEESNYEYLLAMPIGNLTLEKVQELLAEQKKLEDEHEFLGKATPEILWLRDLDALEKELDVLDAKFQAEQEETRRKRENYFKDEKASKAAPKRRRPNKTAAKSQKTNLVGNDDDDFETKPAAQKKKPRQKASSLARDGEDEALELKNRLDVYSFGVSSELSAMETETTKEHNKKGKKGRNEPSKRGTTKKAVAPLTDLSGEDIAVPIHKSEDKKFTVEEAQIEKKSISQNSGNSNTHALCCVCAPQNVHISYKKFKLISCNVVFVQPLKLRLQKDTMKERKRETGQAKEVR
ncbi:DNA topoisomerase 2-like [Aegilops tauschii subsp. strangulata]|uniref:DNA topoisomerase 2-like n=1 Tax=Aegilops tauschii subsp. strangulata TaxID=200361 RepID=UPI003CC8AF4E